MARWSVQVVAAPAYEPVSREDVLRWLRITSDDPQISNYNLTVDRLRQAMREFAENYTGRSFVERTLRLTLDNWPYDSDYGVKICLPRPPLIDVTAFQYIDADGDAQTMDASAYVVHEEFEPGFIIPAWGEAWPTVRRVPNAVQVTFRAGYTPGSPQNEAGYQESIPAALKLWIESRCAGHDQFREQVLSGTIISELPRSHADSLLDSLVVGTRLFGT